MAEYIEREALMKKAIEEKRFVFQMEDLLKQEIVVKTVYKDFFDFIKSIPAADVAPVRHGRWIDLIPKEEKRWACDCIMKCSECKQLYADNRFKYCPNCGSKMDGGESNG